MPPRNRLPLWLVVLLAATAIVVHARVASRRAQGLLEHDEAISLMVAAGKAQLADRFYPHGEVLRMAPAAELQAFMSPTGSTGFKDVMRSLASYDIHPPLYFMLIHAAERIGLTSQTGLRLIGGIVALAAAWFANRWLWRDAPLLGKFLGTAWLLLAPTSIVVATQLRQYSLVYLGTVLSFAGLFELWKTSARPLASALLIASGPIVLLNSQFGTAVWIVLLLVAGLVVGIRLTPVSRGRFLLAVLIAFVVLAPLLYWWRRYAGSIGTAPRIPLDRIWSSVVAPIADGLGHTWLSWPARWKDAGLGLPIAALIAAACGAAAWRRHSPADRVLGLTVLSWLVCWVVLLGLGKAPPHAVSPKYVAPLILGSLVLLVRATASAQSAVIRRTATGVLLVSLFSHGIGIGQLLEHMSSRPLMEALSSTDCMIVNSPRRGYLLPLVAPMRPTARVILAEPEQAVAHWNDLELLLPPEGVVSAGILSPDTDASRELAARLEKKYQNATRLRDEPARSLTWFRRPTTPNTMR